MMRDLASLGRLRLLVVGAERGLLRLVGTSAAPEVADTVNVSNKIAERNIIVNFIMRGSLQT